MTYYISISFTFLFLCLNEDIEHYWSDDPKANRMEFDSREAAEDYEDTLERIEGKSTCVVQSEPND